MKKYLKTVILTTTLILGTITLSACTKQNTTQTDENCFSSGKEINQSQLIFANINKIYREGDDFSLDEPIKQPKSFYTFEELNDLQFGFITGSLDKDYNITYEICSSEGEIIEDAYPDSSTAIYENSKYSNVGMNASHTQFTYESEDGESINTIPETGIYYLNVFAKESSKEEWNWVDQLEFEVKD